MFDGRLGAKKGTSEKVGASITFPRHDIEHEFLGGFLLMFDGCLREIEDTSKKRPSRKVI